jgi:ABC-type bacteriocin/lantibiotic exporter with double-glycine peptidase domain
MNSLYYHYQYLKVPKMFLCHRLRPRRTIVCFTHSDEIMKVADVIHYIDAGKIKSSGSYDDVRPRLL